MIIEPTIYIGKKLGDSLASIIYSSYSLNHAEVISGILCIYGGLNIVFLDLNVVELILAIYRTNNVVKIRVTETEQIYRSTCREINPKEYISIYTITSTEGKEELDRLYNNNNNFVLKTVLQYLIML
jgi:hypothetical protein